MKDTYTFAAFISAGMHRDVAKLDEARDLIGTGCLELVMSAMDYVDLVYNMETVGYATVGEFPGVFAYEVAEEFGAWYVAEAHAKRAVPDVTAACEQLRELAFAFFARDVSDEVGHQLNVALARLHEPVQPEI